MPTAQNVFPFSSKFNAHGASAERHPGQLAALPAGHPGRGPAAGLRSMTTHPEGMAAQNMNPMFQLLAMSKLRILGFGQEVHLGHWGKQLTLRLNSRLICLILWKAG